VLTISTTRAEHQHNTCWASTHPKKMGSY